MTKNEIPKKDPNTVQFTYTKSVLPEKIKGYDKLELYKITECHEVFYSKPQIKAFIKCWQTQFDKYVSFIENFDEEVKKEEIRSDKFKKSVLRRGSKDWKQYQDLWRKYNKEKGTKLSYVEYVQLVVSSSKAMNLGYLNKRKNEAKRMCEKLDLDISLLEELLKKGSAKYMDIFGTVDLDELNRLDTTQAMKSVRDFLKVDLKDPELEE